MGGGEGGGEGDQGIDAKPSQKYIFSSSSSMTYRAPRYSLFPLKGILVRRSPVTAMKRKQEKNM